MQQRNHSPEDFNPTESQPYTGLLLVHRPTCCCFGSIEGKEVKCLGGMVGSLRSETHSPATPPTTTSSGGVGKRYQHQHGHPVCLGTCPAQRDAVHMQQPK
uniref:Uncharacterized protein n=1 Tax=Eutreptiella gymnastica TaxID=73025 RepID=A0A7S4G5K7_9EUGL